MEYMACEYCGRKGTRIGFRGIHECTGCGAPSKSAPVEREFIGITCSGHFYPEDLVPMGERIEDGNLTREGNRT
jgi:hypothetical protein